MIPLPDSTKVIKSSPTLGIFEIEGFYPGYGLTIGNALRRVLLSSIEGAAPVMLRIKGVAHEFSTIPGVLENALEITLSIKKMRVKLHSPGPETIHLHAKGERRVLAGDFKASTNVEITNPDLHIATLTSKNAELDCEVEIARGVGYETIEMRRSEKLPVGVIALDAVYTPVLRVSYETEDMRRGERTDFQRLILEIETDGTIRPEDALIKAGAILVGHFQQVAALPQIEKEEVLPAKKTPSINELSIGELPLPERVKHTLFRQRIRTVGGLLRKTRSQLLELEGMGEKGAEEVDRALEGMGLSLKS